MQLADQRKWRTHIFQTMTKEQWIEKCKGSFLGERCLSFFAQGGEVGEKGGWEEAARVKEEGKWKVINRKKCKYHFTGV